jgi:hypothetical protein
MRILDCGFDFLRPYCESETVQFFTGAERGVCDFALVANQNVHDGLERVQAARKRADAVGLPLCYATCEDPNSFGWTLPQAALADYVFTSDRECVDLYSKHLQHEWVFWLPLAACPKFHYPVPLREDATDFVASQNFYDYWANNGPEGFVSWSDRPRNNARIWGSEVVTRPLAQAGHSMSIFSYEPPPYPELEQWWKGPTSCRTVSDQYAHGRVALGQNNQRSGFDGIGKTVMTSMRTAEVLACGKPFIAPQSDAYEALGFVNGLHFFWSERPEVTLAQAALLLHNPTSAQSMADAGRAWVLDHHLYSHRMDRILRAVKGEADPYSYD